jgi:hypothetical protein
MVGSAAAAAALPTVGAEARACEGDLQGREYVVERGVVGAVVVDVLVADLFAGTDDERRPELGDPPSHLVDPVPGSARPLGSLPAATVREQPEEPDAPNGRCPGGAGVVVDQHGERDALVGDERGRVAHIARADSHDLGPPALDVVVDAPQLRGVLTAEESTEVAEEDQDHGPVRPEVAEPA